MLTVIARISNRDSYPYLDSRAAEYQQLLRQHFADVHHHGKDIESIFETGQSHGWTTRQLNGIKFDVEALTSTWQEGCKTRIESLQQRIKRLETTIKQKQKTIAKQKGPSQRQRLRFCQHNRKRLLVRSQAKLAQLEKDLQAGIPKVCFGSRKRFNAQWHLKENGFANHKNWKDDWQQARNNNFLLIGRGADACGNCDCRMTVEQTDTGDLQATIRLGKLNREIKGKRATEDDYVALHITFRYNVASIIAAVDRHKPLTYRFVKDDGKWTVHLIIPVAAAKENKSDLANGAIGVDLNPDCIAASLIKPDGNLKECRTWQVGNANQIGEAVTAITQWAAERKVPIAIEALQFEQLQKELKTKGINRKLSRFAWSLANGLLHTQGLKQGVEIIEVNSAYSSIIGYLKFHGYGLNRHQAASFCLARRAPRPGNKRFSERARFRIKPLEAPSLKALLPPVDGQRHPWKTWAKLENLLTQEAARPTRRVDWDLSRGVSPTATPPAKMPTHPYKKGHPVSAPTANPRKKEKKQFLSSFPNSHPL